MACRRFSAAIAASLLASSALASPLGAAPNPQLTALIRGVDSEENRSTALKIATMDVAVRIHGGIAETVVTARFDNSGKELLEGSFTLAMPTGSVVTGYALDIDGKMIDGVLVDQIEARRAYESRVRQRIDPGLGEVSRDFEFKTRVYPIEAGKSRTVRVRFVTPLDPKKGYELPLSHDQEIGRFTLSVEASGVSGQPDLAVPSVARPEWRREGERLIFSQAADKARLDGALSVGPSPRSAPLTIGRDSAGETYFELVDASEAGGGEVPRPARVAILWDRSLSRGDDALEAEIGLVKAYLDRVRPESIELILFDSGKAERVAVRDWAEAADRLKRAVYRGATSYASLGELRLTADSCLLFTDGLVTLGSRDLPRLGCPVSIVSSARDADRAWLNNLARGAGGEAMYLTGDNGGQLLARLTRQAVRIAEVRSTTGAVVDFAMLEAPAGGWRIVGPMPAAGGLVVRLTGLESGGAERVYTPGPIANWSGAAPLWATDRLAVRAAGGEETRDSLIAFARRHSVAGPDISFLVLETARDYAEAKIDPPADFPEEELTEYRELVAEREEEEEEERTDRLDEVLAGWEEQKKWWRTKFDPKARADADEKRERSGGRDVEPEPEPIPVPPPPSPPPPPPGPQGEPTVPTVTEESVEAGVQGSTRPEDAVDSLPQGFASGDDDGQDLTVTGTARRRLPAAAVTPGQPDIEATTWSPDRPYLKTLREAAPRERDRVLAEQQVKHGSLPAFWLDVSDYYRRNGEQAQALRLLLSALDLPSRDTETLAIVADRLMRYGEIERAISLYERIILLEPKRPQPVRSLALALGERGMKGSGEGAKADLARAISLLTTVVMTPWSGAYDGIDMIALMEVNKLIPHYRRLGGQDVPLDSRLIDLLDVDVRVVVEWNTEATDLDLWVDEPNGERAKYNNTLTAIGGHMSNDMTQGYGPEEYLLRRAPAGTFTIWADTFSADAINPNGPSRITARLIRDFGRPTEREEVIDIELLPGEGEDDGEDDVRRVGRMFVRPRR